MDAVTKKLSEQIKKKNKQGVNISKKQMKDHMWIFVNCLIENPSFDSQTKEYMTLQVKKFGSTCELSDKFYNGVLKSGIVDAIMTFVHFKAQKEMTKKCFKTKHAKLKGMSACKLVLRCAVLFLPLQFIFDSSSANLDLGRFQIYVYVVVWYFQAYLS